MPYMGEISVLFARWAGTLIKFEPTISPDDSNVGVLKVYRKQLASCSLYDGFRRDA